MFITTNWQQGYCALISKGREAYLDRGMDEPDKPDRMDRMKTAEPRAELRRQNERLTPDAAWIYPTSCMLGCPALSPLPPGKSPGGWRRLRDG